MRAVLVVVADVFRKQPLQMVFIHCNDAVQQVTAATLNPSFCDPVLPGTFERGPHRPDLQGSHRCRNLDSIFAITIKDEKSRSRSKRKRFAQLLDDPSTCGMSCDVEVQDTPTIMTDHEEAVQHAERDRRSREKVHRCDGFPMIAQKSEPALSAVRISRRSFH